MGFGSGICLDITKFDEYGPGTNAQCQYLVHGYDDVMWTDSLDDAVEYLKESLKGYVLP